MSPIPDCLKFHISHEWVRFEPDGSATVGIFHFAQSWLGEIVRIELPKVGQRLNNGESLGTVGSAIAASDVYCPVAGVVIAVNECLGAVPETVNASPYEAGWLIRLGSLGPREPLLDPKAYRDLIGD